MASRHVAYQTLDHRALVQSLPQKAVCVPGLRFAPVRARVNEQLVHMLRAGAVGEQSSWGDMCLSVRPAIESFHVSMRIGGR